MGFDVGVAGALAAARRRACRVRLPAQEAFAAIHRPPLRRFKGNRRLTSALGAAGHRLGFGVAAAGSLPFGLAWLAAFGFVLKVFVVEEVLFSRCKYKLGSAVNALEDSVLELRHGDAPLFTPYWYWILAAGLPPRLRCYSISRRDFFRFRLRASACLTRRFSPGFK